MTILRIQHAVPSYDDWKRVFDSDPLDRKGSGVQRYEIHRPSTDPDLVMVDLHLGSAEEASLLYSRLRELWAGPGGAVMQNPQGWVVETVESVEL